MEKQHLTYFKIENFKRFDSFEMENLGQFNLIVGDNNVGKTSVLEALLFDEDFSKFMSNIFSATNRRYGLQSTPINDDISKQELTSWLITNNRENATKLTYKLLGNSRRLHSFKLQFLEENRLNKKDVEYIKTSPLFDSSLRRYIWVRFLENDQYKGTYPLDSRMIIPKPGDIYMPFIPTNLSYDSDLVLFYFQKINIDKELRIKFNSLLMIMIPFLEDIRVHQFEIGKDSLAVTLTNKVEILPLARFGEGTVKLCRIILEIIMSSNNRLMVDEIDNGLHFSRLKKFWQTVIQLCSECNVQLFATTHSLECQQAFIEALEDSELQKYQKDARNISLLENKQGVVKAVTFDFEQFEYALNIGFNTRGGKA